MTLDPFGARKHFAAARAIVVFGGTALVAVAGFVATWVIPPRPHDGEPHAAQAITRPSESSWERLTASQRELLAPLKGAWTSLPADRQLKWQLIAERAARMPAEPRQRLESRMQAWAHLTPEERANTRWSFLRTADRYSAHRRHQSWASYQGHRPDSPASAPAPRAFKPVSPVVVQAPRGATTMLMTQIYALSAEQKFAQFQEPRGSASDDASAGKPSSPLPDIDRSSASAH